MSKPVTPLSQILRENPRLARAYNLLEDIPSFKGLGVDEFSIACLELGKLHTLARMVRREIFEHCREQMMMQPGQLMPIVPLEIELTQVEEGRWMAEVLAMPGVYANAASKQEAIENVREAALYAIANYQADHKEA